VLFILLIVGVIRKLLTCYPLFLIVGVILSDDGEMRQNILTFAFSYFKNEYKNELTDINIEYNPIKVIDISDSHKVIDSGKCDSHSCFYKVNLGVVSLYKKG